jgi:hypothetical protein
LLRARRQELHARAATVLEQDFTDLVERQPEFARSGPNQHMIAQRAGMSEVVQFLSRAAMRKSLRR